MNFENWVNGEVSKIGHHFRKYSDLKIVVIKQSPVNLHWFFEISIRTEKKFQ